MDILGTVHVPLVLGPFFSGYHKLCGAWTLGSTDTHHAAQDHLDTLSLLMAAQMFHTDKPEPTVVAITTSLLCYNYTLCFFRIHPSTHS